MKSRKVKISTQIRFNPWMLKIWETPECVDKFIIHGLDDVERAKLYLLELGEK